MKKLIKYILTLIIILAAVHITKDIIDFSREIIILKDYKLKAKIKEEKMMHPTVKINSLMHEKLPGTGEDVYIRVSSATGFSIKYSPAENESLVITNDHFCKGNFDGTKFLVETYRGGYENGSSKGFSAKHVISMPVLDLCILSVKGYIKPVEIVDYDHKVSPFEKIYVVGGPSGTFPIIFDSYVSRYMDRKDVNLGFLNSAGNPFILISEQVFPGHSGSPVFNEEGKVVGIVFGALKSYGGLVISSQDILFVLSTLGES